MIICITGGMGSGKSYVAKIFETIGYPVYYSDTRAKQMYLHPEIKEQIINLLGKDAYLNDYQINKKYIANKIFSDKNLLNQLNSIIHPAVKKDFEKFVQENTFHKIIFKESALIFEQGIQNTCNKIILVTAPEELKIKRIQQRDSLTTQEIIARVNHQWTDDKKIPLSDYVIVNDEKQPLLPQIVSVLENIKKEI